MDLTSTSQSDAVLPPPHGPKDFAGGAGPSTTSAPLVRRASSSRVSADRDHSEEFVAAIARTKSGAAGEPVPMEPSPEVDDPAPPVCFICYDEFDRRRPPHSIPCSCQDGHIENRTAVHYGCIRAWAAQKSSCPLCRRALTVQCANFTAPSDLDIADFVTRPLGFEVGVVQCFVRVRRAHGVPVYDLFLEGNSAAQRTHLLTATWQIGHSLRAAYVISLPSGPSRPHDERIATVRANLLGTRWSVVVDEEHPGPQGGLAGVGSASSSISAGRDELVCVGYKPNRFCLDSGPRSMKIATPAVTEDGELEGDRRPKEAEGVLRGAVEARPAAAPKDYVSTFKNRQPVWDERYEAYVLNFLGRVRVASVKNFQIVQTDNIANETLLQFGRVSQSIFSMDVQWPFSIVQAFGVCLTSIAPKLAVK
mmetsp:Transcript_10/g.25  ORF Transcript_10/g.25 Transcript_10/m.25 type:complete len:421 (+) Transcript_10:131-1393(+)|eukprot:CAMPEP_0119413158 /NCGR_PEP_ID=MMETSP1335-20130426/5327_1 /TAXON_ID=259385 /ORGANISM="Chrysoculter rhomboideus, Strain RCC1486" /LENGTH=420 /DNA_ID=CAMNT_0007437937 /DNA_START=135 /DNA_END=1397 /DNA_ORIENTATION=+